MDRWVANSPSQKCANRWYSLLRLRVAHDTLPVASVFNQALEQENQNIMDSWVANRPCP